MVSNLFKNAIILGASTLALGACSSSGGGGTLNGPIVSQFHGDLPADLTVTYDAVADEYTIESGGETVVLTSGGASTPGFAAYEDNVASGYYIKETDSGSAFGAIIGSDDAGLNLVGVHFGRLTETERPTEGTASYSGEYVAILADATDHGDEGRVLGDAMLTADFGNMSIEGTISNRTIDGDEFADVILESTTIDDTAAFSGTATGGRYAHGSNVGTTSNGSYVGLITGANGEDLVGGLRIDHVIDGDNLIEAGVFIASE